MRVTRTVVQNVVVVVPAANEEHSLAGCLDALAVARRNLRAARPRVGTTVLVVLDDCRDATAVVAARYPGVATLAVSVRSAGRARRAGVSHALAGTSCPPDRTWIASTDADSEVPPDWLVGMCDFADDGHHAVLGTVVPGPGLPRELGAEWFRRHRLADGHPYVHGANMGVRADVYRSVGGWPALPAGEDVELARRLTADPQISVVRTAAYPVITSSRVVGRVPDGFSVYLRRLAGVPAGMPGQSTMPSS